MKYIKRLIVAIVAIALVFAALNWPYFKVQIDHYLYPPQIPEIKENQKTAESDKIWIRTLGIEAPLVYIEEDSEEAFQLALQKGVVHFTGTAKIGESGNAYYFGHSSDYLTSEGDYKNVFALLPKIRPGDTIQATNTSGKVFEYEVEKTMIVEPDDLSVLEQDHSKKQLTLQTSYPLGTALRRFIVVSKLIE